ncbi:MAG TPA: hypothetical protein VMK32_13370 [Burkholderiaceae bacterium]|nr:hypothetical protein [Burkholderiaceae bacterium]
MNPSPVTDSTALYHSARRARALAVGDALAHFATAAGRAWTRVVVRGRRRLRLRGVAGA